MTKITEVEQNEVIELIRKYRNLHDQIAEIEVSIKDLEQTMKAMQDQKDGIINGIRDNRENEALLIDKFHNTYGPGKLNLETMEWIGTKPEENEMKEPNITFKAKTTE